jgi:hypothetical protein
MSTLARRAPVAALLAGLAAFGGGCADSESMIFIRQVNLPIAGGSSSDACVTEANPQGPFISHGTLDVAFRREYIAGLVVGSQIVTRGSKAQLKTETSGVRIEGLEARLEDVNGAIVWGPYTIPATGFIDPAIDVTPSYGMVDGMLVGPDVQVSKGVNVRDYLQTKPGTSLRFTSVSKVFGHTLGSQAVESGEFRYPITICYGCLIFYPAEASDPKVLPYPNCDLPQATGSTTDIGCSPGQDEKVDCRVCKATYPGNPICEP